MQRYRPFGNDECFDAALFWDAETINWTKGNELAGFLRCWWRRRLLIDLHVENNRFDCEILQVLRDNIARVIKGKTEAVAYAGEC